MARKNANGRGSRPRKRADGRWEARYWMESPEGRKRRSVYGETRKEAADKLREAKKTQEEPPAAFVPTTISVREFFGQYEDAAKHAMKRRSFETTRDIVRLHLLAAFGDTKLRDVAREDVQRLYCGR